MSAWEAFLFDPLIDVVFVDASKHEASKEPLYLLYRSPQHCPGSSWIYMS